MHRPITSGVHFLWLHQHRRCTTGSKRWPDSSPRSRYCKLLNEGQQKFKSDVTMWCVMCDVVWCVMWCDVTCDVWCVMCDVWCDVMWRVTCDVWCVMWCDAVWCGVWCDVWCDVMWCVMCDMWCDVMWCVKRGGLKIRILVVERNKKIMLKVGM